MKRANQQRITILLFCVCFLFATLFSLDYYAGHADHDCDGEHCQVCVYLQSADHLLQQLKYLQIVTIAALAVMFWSVSALLYKAQQAVRSSLIHLKVRMNQ